MTSFNNPTPQGTTISVIIPWVDIGINKQQVYQNCGYLGQIIKIDMLLKQPVEHKRAHYKVFIHYGAINPQYAGFQHMDDSAEFQIRHQHGYWKVRKSKWSPKCMPMAPPPLKQHRQLAPPPLNQQRQLAPPPLKQHRQLAPPPLKQHRQLAPPPLKQRMYNTTPPPLIIFGRDHDIPVSPEYTPNSPVSLDDYVPVSPEYTPNSPVSLDDYVPVSPEYTPNSPYDIVVSPDEYTRDVLLPGESWGDV